MNYDVFDSTRYPLDQPYGSLYRDLLARIRNEIQTTGYARLPEFIGQDIVAAMVTEVERKRDQLDRVCSEDNPYFSDDDPGLPESHPVRIRYPHHHAWLCRDRIEADSPMVRLFESDALLEFVRAVARTHELYRHNDPIVSLSVNVQAKGDMFAWHFDSTEISISLLLQRTSSGGRFEFVPALRSEDDPNYEMVSAVLRGRRNEVVVLDAQPGDLVVFPGRYSLHRVTPVDCAEERMSLILGYASKPNQMLAKEDVLRAYGRVHPLHDVVAGRPTQ